MATVVRVPRDTRFGELGAGLGNVVGSIVQKRKDEATAAARGDLVGLVIEELGLEPSSELASALSDEEAGLEVPQILGILGSIERSQEEARVRGGMADISEKLSTGDISLEEAATQALAVDPSALNTILPSLIGAESRRAAVAARPDRQEVTFTRTLEDGNIQTRRLRLPVDSDPAETPGGRRLIGEGFTVGKISAAPGATRPTQFEESITATGQRLGLDPNTPEDRNKIVSFLGEKDAAVELLDSRFKAVVEGSSERAFTSARNEQQHAIALELVERKLARGDSAITAVNNSMVEAITQYYGGSWIPLAELVDIEAPSKAEREVNTATNIAAYLMSVREFDEGEVRDWLQRGMGPLIDPTLGKEEILNIDQIETAMVRALELIGEAPVPRRPGVLERLGTGAREVIEGLR